MLQTQLLSPVFVGREPELEALTDLLARAASGSGSAVLIGGDAGIGKSRLCRELKSRAVRQDVRVIEGRCSPAEVAVPYGPFMDALRFRLERGEASEAAEALEPVLAHVAPMFAELARSGGEEAHRPPQALSRPFEPILAALRRYLRRGPALMLLEDIHWADPTSRDLLHYLSQRITTEPLLLVATYQTDEIQLRHPVHRLAAALVRERSAKRIQLEPLRVEQVTAMLEAMLESEPDPDFVRAVHAKAEGNPLFVEELVSVVAQSQPERFPRLTADDLAGASPPATIREIVLGRIEPLGDDAREALEMAAVAGRRFRFDVLAGALDWPEDRLLRAIEPAVARRLLVEDGSGGSEYLLFRHNLVQEVIYGSILARRRRMWHGRVAAALQAAAADARPPHASLAHHYLKAGDPERARAHAVLAGDQAVALCAWPDAEAMYEQALASLEGEPDRRPELEVVLLEKLAQVSLWQNRMEAFSHYDQRARALRGSEDELATSTFTSPLLDRLTSREVQVLDELVEGKTNKQIARALSIRPKTVGNHVSSILAKLECSTRTEASRLALAARFGHHSASDAA